MWMVVVVVAAVVLMMLMVVLVDASRMVDASTSYPSHPIVLNSGCESETENVQIQLHYNTALSLICLLCAVHC
jgi:hypothetical protein